ncbi:MAG: hypothetical protein ACTSRI_16510 [Promethearchaeota archaeon]
MGFKDLKKLGEKENRLFLILIIWLLIGFTLFQFSTVQIYGLIVFLPLLGVCLVLSFAAFILRKNLKELPFKNIFIYCLIALPLMIIFIYISLILFIIAIFSYIFITSAFSIYNCYIFGIKIDEKIYQWPRIISFFVRWGEFIGGILIAVVILVWVYTIGLIYGFTINPIGVAFASISIVIIILIVILSVFAGIFIIIGRLNAWLGIYYIWVAFYSMYLMFSAFYNLGELVGMNIFIYKLILYIFDLFLILFTIGSLVGKRSELISKKLHVKSDSILIWLIFSKAAYEFASTLPDMNIETIRAIGGFILFLPLMFIMGLYGVFHYGKLKRARKAKKEDKQLEIKAKKEGRYCFNCDTINEKGWKFCKECGNVLQEIK